jgi:hypothetical protein
MILNGYVASAALGESQNFQCIELKFTAAAAGTAWTLVPLQQGAAAKVRAITGNASANLLSAGQAAAVVANEAGAERPVAAAETAAIAAKLVTYFTAVPAAADGAKCLAFVIGGLSGKGKVLCAEVSWGGVSGTAAANAVVLDRSSTTVTIAESSTSVSIASTPVVFYPSVGVIAGAIAIGDVLDIPAAGAPVTLKVWLKP